MNRIKLMTVVLLSLSTVAAGQSTAKSDRRQYVRSFELTPVAPPKPAMKYQLQFDELGARRPGNAALLYFDAILLMGPDVKAGTEEALNAYTASDLAKFNSLADSLDQPSVFDELDLAGRREECEWQPPFREKGALTLLPHLEPLAHAMTRLVKVRALKQIEEGKVEDALNTLRLGYEMSNKVGEEGMLISGLVSLHITSEMNDGLATLMDRADCPNLYWALGEFPNRRAILRHSMAGERMWWLAAYPNLARPTSGQDLGIRAAVGENMSAQQWRSLLEFVWTIIGMDPDNKPSPKRPDPVKDASAQTIHQAQQLFAQNHKVSAEEAAKVDPLIVVGEFYFQQYQIEFDESYKLRELPYPAVFVLAKHAAAEMARLHREQRANPFLPVFDFGDTARKFARVDRQLAALTAVEAIRSYAAANLGVLPVRLEDIAETPVPENPMTGKPFDYRVENETATLADSQSEDPLAYTIKIRK